MTPLIIMVGADKGGTGKTTVARALDDYLRSKRANRKVFDSERPRGDLKRFVPAATVIDIEKVDDQMAAFDSIEGVTLIDIRAGLMSPTLKALAEVGLLADVRSGALAMALLHVIGPSVSSLLEIAETAAAIGGGVQHYLVKNYVSAGGFAEWDKDPRFAAVLQDAAARTITVAHLTDTAAAAVQRAGVAFEAFAEDRASHGRMLAGYVRNWLAGVWSEFDRVGLGKLIEAATAA
jgi:hypothetical protein